MAIEPFLSTTPQRVFLGLVILQAVAVIALIASAFGIIQAEIKSGDQVEKTVPCYFAIFGLAELYELILTLDALYLRNIMQLGGILAFHVGLLVYASLQIHQTQKAILISNCGDECDARDHLWTRVKAILIVVPIVIGVGLLLLTYTFRFLYHEFGWAVFHHLGADPRKKRMYRWYQIMLLLIKMDWFFFTGLTLQLLILVLQESSAEFGVTIAAIPIVLFLLGACAVALKREIKWLMLICLVLFCLSQGYFIFKFVRYYSPDTQQQYETTRATLTVFTVIAFLIDFASFFIGIICYTDFDKGLRAGKVNEGPSITRGKSANSAPGTPMFERNSSYNGAPLQQRISIE